MKVHKSKSLIRLFPIFLQHVSVKFVAKIPLRQFRRVPDSVCYLLNFPSHHRTHVGVSICPPKRGDGFCILFPDVDIPSEPGLHGFKIGIRSRQCIEQRGMIACRRHCISCSIIGVNGRVKHIFDNSLSCIGQCIYFFQGDALGGAGLPPRGSWWTRLREVAHRDADIVGGDVLVGDVGCIQMQ